MCKNIIPLLKNVVLRLRCFLEAVTDSCLSTDDDEEFLHKLRRISAKVPILTANLRRKMGEKKHPTERRVLNELIKMLKAIYRKRNMLF